jgi:hypothetical protein
MTIALTGQGIANLDVAFNSIAAPVNITATSSATGTTAISTGVFGVQNAGNYYVEVFSPLLTKGTTNLDLELWDGGTSGTFLTTLTGHMTASTALGQGVKLEARVSLSQGAHNMVVTGFVDAGTGVFGAGAATTGNQPNAFIRVRSA